MYKYNYEYVICNVFDEDIFKRQCAALERNIPALIKNDYLEDVDGSQIQSYLLNGKEVNVLNAAHYGVEIRSQVDINPYFEN
ncbi:MAG: hypothetical protein ACOX05_05760 [Bacillota bacterium]|jgi:hypothetical protein